MDFFAVVDGQIAYRLDLEQQLQKAMSAAFGAQALQLLDPDLEVVEFKRENFNPDESEVLEITPFDLPANLYDITQNPVGAAVLPIDEEQLSRVTCVYGYDAQSQRVCFQVIGKSQRLSKNILALILSKNTFQKLGHAGLVIGNECHAVFENNSIKFKSIYKLKQIIDISAYYREATAADVQQFAQLPNLKVANQAMLEGSGAWVRTRVAYILDSGVLTAQTPQQLSTLALAAAVKLDFVSEDGVDKLVIPDDRRQLRAILKFLEEEYYSGAITGLPYEANSKRKR